MTTPSPKPAAHTPLRRLASGFVIIRAIWERGNPQAEAVAEMERRGLWLTNAQRIQAGLS